MSRNRIMDRRALFASGAAAALLAATGVSAGPAPTRGGRLRLALSGAHRTDSWATSSGLFMQVARLGIVFETLTEIAADGTVRGELATDWKTNTDATHWLFSLRRDVQFHGGQQLTAEDVVFSLPGFDVRARDPWTVEIQSETPMPNLPFRLAGPEAVIMPSDGSGAQGNGTGLYQVTRFDPGRQILADRVAIHHRDGQAGWFDRVELVSLPLESVRAQALSEYLVDAADVAEAPLTETLSMHQWVSGLSVSRDVVTPVRSGSYWPADNLRAPERWWQAEGL